MAADEIERRARDERVAYLKKRICDKNGDKKYVFISYKSDDWETVLGDIVYRLVKDYGLQVYFDGSFDSHASLWIQQFPENMKDYKCKGVLAFVDDLYSMSYATLLEVMCSQRKLGKKRDVIPINIGKITEKTGAVADADTGLGRATYEDGTKNIHAQSEKELFDRIFNELVERKILDESKYVYGKEAGVEMLTKGSCSDIMEELLRHISKNDNPYSGPNGDLSNIVGTINDAFGEEVFGEPDKGVTKDDGETKPTTQKPNVEIGIEPKQKEKTNPDAPSIVTIIPDGKICSYGNLDKRYYAFYRMDGETYTILRGSRICIGKFTPKKLYAEFKDRLNDNNYLLCDISGLPISTAAKFITGDSTAGKELESEKRILKENVVVDVEYKLENGNDETNPPLPPSESLQSMLATFIDKFDEQVQGRKSATTEAEKEKYRPGEGNWMYDMVCKKIPAKLAALFPLSTEKYEYKSSVGRGGWADCPWVALFNRYITESTQHGIYIVYLLNPKTKELYLTLNQGINQFEEMAKELGVEGTKQLGYKKKEDFIFEKIKASTEKIRSEVEIGSFSQEQINTRKEGYDLGCVCSKKYTLDNLPADDVLVSELEAMLRIYDQYYEKHKAEYPSGAGKSGVKQCSTLDGSSALDRGVC